MRTIKYYLGEILKDGLPCSNAIVRWETLSPCIVLTCHLPDKVVDGKKLTNGVEFSIDDDMENCSPCVKYHIECPGCTNCPIVDKTLCFCTGPTDCPPCHVCINGECIPTCDICDPVTGDCVSCNDEHPCPGDQICVQGECQCPQGKYDPVTGKCVECIVGDVNPNNPCLICLGGSWAQKICASGVVDPVTCDCTGCNGNTDCGENQCCYDGECLCCKDSAIYDPILGKCVPKPPCDPNTPCPECMDCLNGQCVPRVCPEGYICVGDSCVPECDCNNPTCNTANACVPTADGRCYCSPCSGACSSGAECGPGCYCDNGQCKPKPCVGTCVDGTECGPGCGCLNGECVPCNSVNCANNPTACTQILGCKCSGGGCEKAIGCQDKECTSSANCNDGCTCDEGICKECANYSCAECANRPGCKCIDGLCVNDPDSDCKDKLTLTKIDETCDLKAELILTEGCACPVLTLDSKITNVSEQANYYEVDLIVELRKGKYITSPLLGDLTSDTIADNDKPLSGNIKVTVVQTNKVLQLNNGTFTYNETQTILTDNLTGKDTAPFDDVTIPKIGSVIAQSSASITTVYKVEIIVEQTSDFTFANGCTYKAKNELKHYVFTTNGQIEVVDLSTFNRFKNITSANKRDPRFTWFKTKDGVFDAADKFRDLYIKKIGGKYTDTLLGLDRIFPKGKYPLVGQEGELWSGYNYLVKSDCGCAEDAGLDNVVFCNPKTVSFELNACHTGIKFIGQFNPCDVNQDIRPHQSALLNIPDAVQTVYELWINGTKFKSFVHNASYGGMVVWDSTKTGNDRYTTTPMISSNFFFTLNDEEIKTAVIKINHGGDCDINMAIPSIAPRVITETINCNIIGNEYEISVNANQGGHTITNISGANSFSLLGGIFKIRVTRGVATELTFIFSDGCKTKKTYNECACDDFSPSITLTGQDFCAGGTGHITISGTGKTGATLYYVEDGVSKTQVLGAGDFIINSTANTKTVTLTSIMLDGCTVPLADTITINKITNPIATITADPASVCSGGDVNLVIGGTTGATVLLYANNIPTGQTITIPSTVIVNPTVSTTYKVNNVNLQGCSNNANTAQVAVTVTPGPAPLTWTDTCSGGIITRTFTFNQAVVYNGGAPSTSVAVPSGIGSIVVTYGTGICATEQTIVVNPCDCPDITSVITATPSILCLGASSTLSAVITGGSGVYTYQWFKDGAQVATTSTLNITPSASALYSLIVTDSSGCVSEESFQQVTVNNPPPVDIIPLNGQTGVTYSNGNYLICNTLTSVDFIVNPIYNPTSVTWTVVGTYSGTTPFTNSVINIELADFTAPITLNVSVTDVNGCTNTASVQLIQQACPCLNPPTAIAGADITSVGVTPVPLSGSVINAPSSLWTTNGTGTFANALLPNTTYTPSAADVIDGSIILTLTANDNDAAGPCTAGTDTLVLTLSSGACNGGTPNNSIDMTQTVVSYAGKEFAMLTDLRLIDRSASGLPQAYIWSNNSAGQFNSPPNYVAGTVYNGTQEYFFKNTSGCAAQIVADAVFSGPDNGRVIVATLANVATQANLRLASMPAPYNSMFLTATGTVLKLNNAPYCFSITGVAELGNVDTCGTGYADTTLSGRIGTTFTPINS